MPRTWGRLLAIGAKESEPYRRIELDLPEVAIGRGEGSYERIADNTISSTHCRITVRRTPADVALAEVDDDDDVVPIVPRLVAEVWIEDCSANGTFLNSQRLGKGKSARLTQNDEIGFIRPCGGQERPPYAFIFQDFLSELEPHELDALRPPPPTAPATPREAVKVAPQVPSVAVPQGANAASALDHARHGNTKRLIFSKAGRLGA